ncbi:MAG: UDP-N-acetylmuramoyl-tripeptide--D-alanyl-D-alanine ligase [Firmicutes bacterium]|nr:UDP-N-acetylmuramoyl-tripeptide--D-alanyl-D-alanine ligase [Bacillota bacterium]MBQ4092247.1 UDP-N-acetylmuramoyl-tripeptide--D-alanyl-D-alanine ligase [Bacillota bacterium]
MIYTLISLLWIAASVPYMIFAVMRLASELHMMQQNTYRNDRYIQWWKTKGKRDYHDFLGLLAVFPLMFIDTLIGELVALLLWIMVYVLFIRGRDKTPAKKPLVFTERATRLYTVTIAVYFIPTIALLFLGVSNAGASSIARGLCLAIIAVLPFISPLFMLVANHFMQPFEEHKKSAYFNDAKEILASRDDLIKVAITGSYGKTSVKHVLNRMLEEKYYTLMPPGSYNTPMGITRVVREQLKPIHQAFIAEMGAKQKGDIAELCDLVDPKYGMITALGEAHLETFGTFEQIVDTKFELVDSLSVDDIAVLNFDDPAIRANAHRMAGKVIRYGIHGDDLDFWAEKIRYTDRGMEFVLHSKDGAAVELRTRLLGEHNVQNIVGAAAMANQLGVNYKQIKRAVSSLQPVEHRLELKTTATGLHIIDDAFNSNPVGAAAAMNVFRNIENGKKFLITPGMVELGEKEYEENKKFGVLAAEVCDYIALVGITQTEALKEGILEAGFPEENLFVAENLNEANSYVFGRMGKGDYVLYENDLPDTYNE